MRSCCDAHGQCLSFDTAFPSLIGSTAFDGNAGSKCEVGADGLSRHVLELGGSAIQYQLDNNAGYASASPCVGTNPPAASGLCESYDATTCRQQDSFHVRPDELTVSKTSVYPVSRTSASDEIHFDETPVGGTEFKKGSFIKLDTEGRSTGELVNHVTLGYQMQTSSTCEAGWCYRDERVRELVGINDVDGPKYVEAWKPAFDVPAPIKRSFQLDTGVRCTSQQGSCDGELLAVNSTGTP
jgi:hypothetical protein